jgi:hypothetical protein
VFDFRYHALSLAAVLIALLVGLLLGVAIGDAGLVSSAERNLRERLRADVHDANRRADELRGTLGQELGDMRKFEEAIYPRLVGGQLPGREIGLILLGRPSDEIARHVRDALQGTGGRVVLRAVVREPLDLGGLAARARGTRYGGLNRSPELVEPFGVRVGVQLVSGGRLVGQVRSSLLRSFNGALQPLNGVVVARLTPKKLPGDSARAVDAFERGLIRGLTARNVPTVGIELTSTDPSHVSWYRDRDLPSVDNVDQVAGRAALVFTLQGGVDGAFGFKPSAEAVLPDIVRAGR